MPLRHQLPVFSPIPARATLAATAQVLRLGSDPRPKLRDLLVREYDSDAVVLCATGTQALTLAIRYGARSADRAGPIALPAFSCFDLASAAIGANARVGFYDVDPETLAPDPYSLEQTLRAGAVVVVVAPLYGIPVDWESLEALCQRYGAILIEDAAQGFGALWKGRRLGSLGALATLSFGRGKGWTGGNGGALLINRPDGTRAAEPDSPGFRGDARTVIGLVAQWALARPGIYGVPVAIPSLRLGQTVYRPPEEEESIGRAAAAALIQSLSNSEKEAATRRENAKDLLGAIAENPRLTAVGIHREATPGYLRLPLRLSRGMTSFVSESRALAQGIAPSYPLILPDLPPLAKYRDGPQRKWPGARTLVNQLVTLPTHSRLRREDLAGLAEVLRRLGR
jgi:perosamine synthetase